MIPTVAIAKKKNTTKYPVNGIRHWEYQFFTREKGVDTAYERGSHTCVLTVSNQLRQSSHAVCDSLQDSGGKATCPFQ